MLFRSMRAFLWVWAPFGCTGEPITFRTQADTVSPPADVSMEDDVSAPDDDSSVDDDPGGGDGPRDDDPDPSEPPFGPETTPQDAGAISDPPVDEFELGRPRVGRPPPSDANAPCDGGRCSCQSDFDCSPLQPSCDLDGGGVCVQCLTFQDCEAFAFGDQRPICDLGECVPCSDDTQCPINGNPWECRAGSCVEFCNGNGDCSPGRFCQDGSCTTGEVLPPDSAD